MKKIVTLGALSLGIIFLAGCGQQQANQDQLTAPAPVAQPPIQPADNQQPVTPTPSTSQSNDNTSWKTYTDKTAGYQITLPDAWKGYQANDQSVIDNSTNICFIFNEHSKHCIFSLYEAPISKKNNLDLYNEECAIGETTNSVIVASDCCKGVPTTGTNDKLDAFQNARCAEAPANFKTFQVVK